jgi:hypothetical protein
LVSPYSYVLSDVSSELVWRNRSGVPYSGCRDEQELVGGELVVESLGSALGHEELDSFADIIAWMNRRNMLGYGSGTAVAAGLAMPPAASPFPHDLTGTLALFTAPAWVKDVGGLTLSDPPRLTVYDLLNLRHLGSWAVAPGKQRRKGCE